MVEKIKEEDVLLVWCEELPEEFLYAEEWYFANDTKTRMDLYQRLEAHVATLAPPKVEVKEGEEGVEGGEEADEEEEEDEEYEVPPVREGPLFPKAWTDNGTESEMDNLRTKDARPRFKVAFTKQRRKFGEPVKFNYHDADIDDMHAEVRVLCY